MRRKTGSTGRKLLGAYAIKHAITRVTPGHKRVLRGRVTETKPNTAPREPVSRSAQREFMVFCVKHILTSAELVAKDGPYWRLLTEVAGVNPGEDFTSLDACAKAIVSSAEVQYRREREFPAAA